MGRERPEQDWHFESLNSQASYLDFWAFELLVPVNSPSASPHAAAPVYFSLNPQKVAPQKSEATFLRIEGFRPGRIYKNKNQ